MIQIKIGFSRVEIDSNILITKCTLIQLYLQDKLHGCNMNLTQADILTAAK